MKADKSNQEGKVLGKKIDTPQEYAPEILVPIPRSWNRTLYNIPDKPPLFYGYDTWHAYEIGFLTEKGLPVTGLLKIVYPSNSTCIVESKSLKLYLNSINMTFYGKSKAEGIQTVCNIIKSDLNKLLNCTIDLHFYENSPEEINKVFSDFPVLENSIRTDELSFNSFKESPELLKSSENKTLKIASHLLRSNCKVTHQPDWGSVFIYLEGETTPELSSLLQYLVSFRNEYHFHEEICEMIYKRLLDKFSPKKLMVTCIYTRRGGIDICPSRASHPELLPKNLCTASSLTEKLLRQ